MNRRLFLLGSAAAIGAGSAAQAREAGFLMFGGGIHTVDAAGDGLVEALVVREGKVVFTGPLDQARPQAEGLAQIDLKGASAYPGFVDSHVHLTGVGLREMTLNLDQVKSIAELVQAVAAWSTANPGKTPVVGRGWIETHWPEKRFPSRADLDAVAPDRPVVLERADGHAAVLNSAALRLAGITARTPDPAGGRIERDAAGEPTGMLVDGAMALIETRLPPLSFARRKAALQRATALYAARGWTGAVNMSTSAEDLKALQQLAAEGRLPIRVDVFMTPEDSADVLRRGPFADKTGLVRVRGVKLYMDGALGSRGAALLAPYSDRPDTSGLLIANHDATLAILKQALTSKAQVAMHAIGDRGNRLTLDWFEEAFAANPDAAKLAVWRVEHAQIVERSDMPRFGALGLVASMQASHAIGDLYFAPARLGPDRLDGAYAWQGLMLDGARLALGSDAPVEVGDPLIEYYAAVARKDLAGRSGEDWHPEEALTRDRALAAFTTGAAWAVQRADEIGGLQAGQIADITVFSGDLMTGPERDILKRKPLLTIVGGKIVHDAR